MKKVAFALFGHGTKNEKEPFKEKNKTKNGFVRHHRALILSFHKATAREFHSRSVVRVWRPIERKFRTDPRHVCLPPALERGALPGRAVPVEFDFVDPIACPY